MSHNREDTLNVAFAGIVQAVHQGDLGTAREMFDAAMDFAKADGRADGAEALSKQIDLSLQKTQGAA